MTLKETLELLWKYLLLGVIVFAIFSFSEKNDYEDIEIIGAPGQAMIYQYDMDDMDMDTKDSVIIHINGKVLTGKDALKWQVEHGDGMSNTNMNTELRKWIDKDGEKHIIIKKVIIK